MKAITLDILFLIWILFIVQQNLSCWSQITVCRDIYTFWRPQCYAYTPGLLLISHAPHSGEITCINHFFASLLSFGGIKPTRSSHSSPYSHSLTFLINIGQDSQIIAKKGKAIIFLPSYIPCLYAFL